MTKEAKLLQNTEKYVVEMMEEKLSPHLSYHNLDHTRRVVEMVGEIGKNSEIEDRELLLVKIAAWFHDLGYLTVYEGHEQESISLAERFLHEHEADHEDIHKVSRLIAVTELEVLPENLSEKIIKDADMSHLGSPEGLVYTDEVRREWEHYRNVVYTDKSWDKLNYKFYRDHHYYTQYANEKFGKYKAENTSLLKKKVKASKNKDKSSGKPKNKLTRSALEIQLANTEEKLNKTKRKLKLTQELRPDRGIETMYRTTYRTHISLSSIADNKANILLTVSTLLMGVIFTEIIQKSDFDDLSVNSFFVYPVLTIILVCMATIVFAILATRPKVNSGVFTREDILQKKTNLLFFGNYHGMPLDDYMWGVGEMMKDAEYLYGSMSKDLFFLGKVLAKKFQYLRIAYNIFMYGIGISLLVAGIMFFVDISQSAA